jgi:hypothetical protein
MNERAASLASRLDRVTDELVLAVTDGPDGHWRATSPAEERSVGTTVHHIAQVTDLVMSFAQPLAAGQPLPPLTWEMVNAANAQHAAAHPAPDKQETLLLLRRASDDAARAIRQLTAEQLDRTSPWGLTDGDPISVEQLIERNVIDHTRDHLASIKDAAISATSIVTSG